MDELRLELLALMDEAVPPKDLALCFSYVKPGVGFEECTTYYDIWQVYNSL